MLPLDGSSGKTQARAALARGRSLCAYRRGAGRTERVREHDTGRDRAISGNGRAPRARRALARVLRFTQRYLSNAQSLGVRGGSAVSGDVARVLRALTEAPVLPGPSDVSALLAGAAPVQVFAHGRLVPGHDLWVWYRATTGEVRVEDLTKGL